MFERIKDLLVHFKPLITSQKTLDNLSDQTSFLSVIQILLANFKAMTYCGIKLPDILEEDSIKEFILTYQSSIMTLVENGLNKDIDNICGNLWEEIHDSCVEIMSFSISLLYADSKAVIADLAKMIQ